MLIVDGTPADVPGPDRPVLALGPPEPRDHSTKNFLTFNKSDDAQRVQDILTGLAWLHKRFPNESLISLIAMGTQGSIQALFAAAVSPVTVKLRNNMRGFRGSDEDFLKYFNVPGIQTANWRSALKLSF